MNLHKKKWWLTPLVLLLLVFLLHLLSAQHLWIEKIYSSGIYPVIASFLRIVTAWLPFSLGDILYAVLIIWILVEIVRFFRNQPTWKKLLLSARNLLVKFLWLYLFFLLMWGLNYYRYGIGYKLQIYPDTYSTNDLKTVSDQLIEKLNASRKQIDSLHIQYADDKTTLSQAADLYETAKEKYAFLEYDHHNIKKMLFATIGNYGGFLGYYNPFTGEAQVNTQAPAFTVPFTACHEIGHQLGYASESEASFVGFLAIRSNNSIAFNYSAYFDLFAFANGELYMRDSLAARQNIKLLDTLVRKDYAEYRNYLKNYQNPIEPLLTKIYGKYLQAHNQPKGIDSYDEVVAWIIAYYKKYGKL